VLRVLIADDQIPPDTQMSDAEVLAWAEREFPGYGRNFWAACPIMQQAVATLADGFDVTPVRRMDDALDRIRRERFDVAIIDLGWAGDRSVTDKVDSAGWALIEAIRAADKEHPERPPTDQIIYSARFEDHPTLGHEAAERCVLPFYKPYGERHSIRLGTDPPSEVPKQLSHADQVRVACESLRAVVKYVEFKRGRDVNRLLQSAYERLARAENDHHQWQRLTQVLLVLGVLIVFVGVVWSLFGSVEQGAVSAAAGVMVSLIPRLIYRRLDKAHADISDAREDLKQTLARSGSFYQAAPPPTARR
jgi:CheY-like chemotaxis protein